MDVCVFYDCCVLRGSGLSVGMITCPEKSYRVSVLKCDQVQQ
jgi:hypothetical protein